MRLRVRRELDAHFLEADEPSSESFEHDGVRILVSVSKPEDRSFAGITCTGAVDLEGSDHRRAESCDRERGVIASVSDGLILLVPAGAPNLSDDELTGGYQRIEAALTQVGALLRWRFDLSGSDSVFKQNSVILELDDGQIMELQQIPQAAMGDDMAHLAGRQLADVPAILANGTREPLAHQLLREAWNLRHGNPRASLVIAVAAAEVGIKQLIAALVPDARWLVEELPSPPLVAMMKDYLKELPIRADVAPARRSPKHLRKLLHGAVEARNQVVHRGATPAVSLRETLAGVREFLYLLDFYGGQPWAVSRLSPETRSELGLADPRDGWASETRPDARGEFTVCARAGEHMFGLAGVPYPIFRTALHRGDLDAVRSTRARWARSGSTRRCGSAC